MRPHIYIQNDIFQQMVEHTISTCYIQTVTKTLYKLKIKAMKITTAYGEWLDTQKWDYFIRIRKQYHFSRRSVQNLFSRIQKEVLKKDFPSKVFIVGERDSGDITNYHIHILLDCTPAQKNKFMKWFFGQSDEQLILPKLDGAGYYISKFVDRDIEYDFFHRLH